MIPRFGGAVGITRMIRAMKMEGLLEEQAETTQQLAPAFA